MLAEKSSVRNRKCIVALLYTYVISQWMVWFLGRSSERTDMNLSLLVIFFFFIGTRSSASVDVASVSGSQRVLITKINNTRRFTRRSTLDTHQPPLAARPRTYPWRSRLSRRHLRSIAKIPLGWTCRAHAFWLCRACLTARLDTLVSTRSTRRPCRVVLRRDVTSQVEFWLWGISIVW